MNEEKQVKEALIRLAYFVLGVMVCALLSWLLPKWGIGVQDGYGLRGAYVGVGLTYNVIGF